MRPYRRRGYALLYVLAAFPLIAVVSMVAIQILQRTLSAQHLLVKQIDNDAAMDLLIRRLQRDAEHPSARQHPSASEHPSVLERPLALEATTAADGKQLRLHGPRERITYRVDGRAVIRTGHVGQHELPPERWSFRDVEVRFAVERFDHGGQVVWVRFELECEQQERVAERRQQAAAVRFGPGDGR